MIYTPVEEVRLLVGDLASDYKILPDESYQYFLNKYNGNVNRAAIDSARCILMELTRTPVKERAGQIEVWMDWAAAYRRALQLFIRDPNLSLSNFKPYAGGISKSDMRANDMDRDNVRPSIYNGMADGKKPYNNNDDMSDDESKPYHW